MSTSIFDPNADQSKFKYWTSHGAPQKVYSILFTPRSGSSWLTSVLSQTKMLGTPEEWFNPQLMPSSSRSKGARNIDQFIEAISRHEIHGNVFGFEITHHQLISVFGSDDKFMSRFGQATFFWLIRKDIVAQGVSLDKMVKTNVSHSAINKDEDIKKGDVNYTYDPNSIKKWILHIRTAEKGTEKMLSTYGVSPIRISYEGITSSGEGEVTSMFFSNIGINAEVSESYCSGHRKIGTEKNNIFAERFRAENRDFLDSINSERAEMISNHI